MDAKQLATKLHNAQEQLYGGEPYSKHLNDVVANAKRFIYLIDLEDQQNVLDAAWCHDLIEDTEMSPRRLIALFNKSVAKIVLNVSNVISLDKVEETLLTLANIHGHKESIFVKLCDRMANGVNSKQRSNSKEKSMFKKYKHVYPTFRYALKNENEFCEMWKELDEIFEYKNKKENE